MATDGLSSGDEGVTSPFCRASARDRAVHGWSVVLTGGLVGVLTALTATLGTGVLVWYGLVLAAAGFAISWWRERATDARPRRARRTETIGTILSCGAWVGILVPFVFFDAPLLSPAAATAAGAVVATPAIVAGLLVRRPDPVSGAGTSTEPFGDRDDKNAHQVQARIRAALTTVDEAEHTLVGRAVPVRTSVLSDQIRALQSAGDVRVRRWAVPAHPRSWIRLTSSGHAKVRLTEVGART